MRLKRYPVFLSHRKAELTPLIDIVPNPHPMNEDFQIIGRIKSIRTIALGNRIREIARLKKVYGKGRWRKLKGIALVMFRDGTIRSVELHWYEAHGIGRKKVKIKRFLD